MTPFVKFFEAPKGLLQIGVSKNDIANAFCNSITDFYCLEYEQKGITSLFKSINITDNKKWNTLLSQNAAQAIDQQIRKIFKIDKFINDILSENTYDDSKFAALHELFNMDAALDFTNIDKLFCENLLKHDLSKLTYIDYPLEQFIISNPLDEGTARDVIMYVIRACLLTELNTLYTMDYFDSKVFAPYLADLNWVKKVLDCIADMLSHSKIENIQHLATCCVRLISQLESDKIDEMFSILISLADKLNEESQTKYIDAILKELTSSGKVGKCVYVNISLQCCISEFMSCMQKGIGSGLEMQEFLQTLILTKLYARRLFDEVANLNEELQKQFFYLIETLVAFNML